MNFFDILYAKNHGEALSISHFDALFAKYISPAIDIWAKYDGTLPARYTANGSALADYRVYGSAGGVGDRTENLFDKNAKDTANGYVNAKYLLADGSLVNLWSHSVSEYIELNEGNYTISGLSLSYARNAAVCIYDSNYQYVRGIEYAGLSSTSFIIESTEKYIRVSVLNSANSIFMLTEGSTAPAEYVPYGYKLDMSVSDGTTSTTMPIYIGDEPLGEDEYVSFEEQKIYRMIDGVLTPTDPPVPFPALPTVDGTTITDYAGQSAAAPSRFYAKYRKEGY